MAAVGATGVHVATTVGPLTVVVAQVVLVKLLAAVGPLGAQAATGTFVVTTAAGQVVVV